MLRTPVLLAAALLLCHAPSTAAWSLVTLARAPPPTRAASSRLASHARMQEDATPAPTATIEFIEGVPEPVVPDVKLTRSRDGSTGVATFTFDNPSFLAVETTELGDTTGLRARPARPLTWTRPAPGVDRPSCAAQACSSATTRASSRPPMCARLARTRASQRRRPPRAARRPSPSALPTRVPSRVQVTATFINGKPRTVKGVVVIKGEAEWDRFMRFMER